jgi:L-iditol 2-dehydrogenase
MKCAVLSATEKLEIIERDAPVCGPDDVVVAVDVCGVCRTDRKAFHMGQRDLVMPRILGHEIVGTIHEVGEKVVDFQPGDRVQVYPGVVCGVCDYCIIGDDHLCDDMQIIGFHLDGGFTELMHIRGGSLYKIPEHLDSRTASLAEPLACSLNIQKRLAVDRAETVVLFGAGPLGALSAQLARHFGAGSIIVVEPMAARRETASLYSDHQLDFNEDTAAQIMEITHGRGADIVLPCCPGNDPFVMGLEVAAKRGRLGFFSGLTDATSINNHALNNIHYRELSVVGSYGCSSIDDRESLELLAAGKVGMAGLPTLDISWEELPEILSHLEPFEHIFTFFRP